MKTPIELVGNNESGRVVATVTDTGEDWFIIFTAPDGADPVYRYRSTLQTRPDNGALYVAKIVRGLGFWGSLKVTQWSE